MTSVQRDEKLDVIFSFPSVDGGSSMHSLLVCRSEESDATWNYWSLIYEQVKRNKELTAVQVYPDIKQRILANFYHLHYLIDEHPSGKPIDGVKFYIRPKK